MALKTTQSTSTGRDLTSVSSVPPHPISMSSL
jgi:hypothetical protein